MVELVDTLALGASAFGRGGSSPLSRTKVKRPVKGLFTLVGASDLKWRVVKCSEILEKFTFARMSKRKRLWPIVLSCPRIYLSLCC